MSFFEESYDVIVIGAGHAGCEAALASARLGLKTIVFTISMDSIAMMPCNPNIGGTSKGHLVREIDAIGGQMGKNIDDTFIQSRMLNTGKGPAVHSLRAQADKYKYSQNMKKVLEDTDNLRVRQGEVTKIIIEENSVTGVQVLSGAIYKAKAVVIAAGTFSNAKCIYGDVAIYSGANGLLPSTHLADSLIEAGTEILRFKTGTPARVDGRTIDYSKMEEQKGDESIVPFSFTNFSKDMTRNQLSCYLTYTNANTHEIIRNNLDRSPLYCGVIEGTGTRYCPSIEDKVVRFHDKERHQVFLEPEGENTNEMYVQGMSTSLPEDVQREMLRTLPGLENCDITRTGYAIEYDCINPFQLKTTLEFKNIKGLFSAGQFNGSSGYEEAAGQGIIAGINAALEVKGREQITIDRSQGYIGVLIDDLVTKGTREPYRMMTSRAEYRLLLRQDNADLRLTEIGYRVGLINQERWDSLLLKRKQIEEEIKRLSNVIVGTKKEIQDLLLSHDSTLLRGGISLADLLKRPELTYGMLEPIDQERPSLSDEVIEQVEIQIKYEGYISRQMKQVEQFKKLEKRLIPSELDYEDVYGLRIEAKQKLNRIKPDSIGQASRISGVSPSDISVLLVFLEQYRSKRKGI